MPQRWTGQRNCQRRFLGTTSFVWSLLSPFLATPAALDHSDSIPARRHVFLLLPSSASNDHQFPDLPTQPSRLLPSTPVPTTDLWIESFLRNHESPPPSYDDSVTDLPPDYTYTDALATAHTPEYTPFPSLDASLCSDVPNCLRISRYTSPASSLFIDDKSLYADIDFGFSDEGVRSHAKKKKNAAAKKATNTSNAYEEPSPTEEPPPPPEDPPPPADGGDSGGGDGGDGDKDKDKDKDKPDDEWGDWGDVSTKKKKKSKKQAQEEEAERLKKEEEEAAATKAAEEEAERVKQEEEAAAADAAEAEKAAAAAGPDLSWANDTPATDDWAFGTTSKKKKKKGKVRRFACYDNDIWQGAN